MLHRMQLFWVLAAAMVLCCRSSKGFGLAFNAYAFYVGFLLHYYYIDYVVKLLVEDYVGPFLVENEQYFRWYLGLKVLFFFL